MKIHTMLLKIKKQNDFIFSSLATYTCQMCLTPTLGYQIIVFNHDYLYVSIYSFFICLTRSTKKIAL